MADQTKAFASVKAAITAIRDGRPVLVVDDEDRENEGDLIFASELATPDLVAFMVRFTSGYICVAVTEEDADRLDLPPMFRVNQDRHGTAYTVTVDAREGISTGISAADRARTISLLAHRDTEAVDLSRPGHVVPLRAKAGGCCAAPATPRPPSTWPACAPPGRCVKSSARRTRPAWRAVRSCGHSPTSTTL
ncbi:MAG: 3,4-dihydroxy 2-butanone 4-phosphate synthase / cyclohydrolase [Pseudonocardiales bacterium]|nr:3,4-dihydroxy 2-butanone 4-phosphate synthase / cyclohydrolase [Pseudonocardiales bacterium]